MDSTRTPAPTNTTTGMTARSSRRLTVVTAAPAETTPGTRPATSSTSVVDGIDLPLSKAAPASESAARRASRPDYGRWLHHALKAGGCTNPIRLAGRTSREIDGRTGEILTDGAYTVDMPDGVLYKGCGNRRAAVCPACAELYRADAYQLVLAGLRGGKGVPGSVAGHPAVFATFTAPGFGLVHTTRTTKRGKPAPCRVRRTLDRCAHGVVLRCDDKHAKDDRRLGTPLCPACYDYHHQAVWNAFAAELWRRTTIAATRVLYRWAKAHGYTVWDPDAKRHKLPVRLSYGKVAELQKRGVVHYHAIVRFDGINPTDPEAVIAPPEWANGFLLASILQTAARNTTFATPALQVLRDDQDDEDDDWDNHDDDQDELVFDGQTVNVDADSDAGVVVSRPDGWVMTWGEQLDIRPIDLGRTEPVTDARVATELDQHDPNGRHRILSGPAVAGYLAKYATKSTEATGHISRRLTSDTIDLYATDTHPGRLIRACWDIGIGTRGIERSADPYRRLRRWAHQLGYGGHFFTKTRRYSTTFTRLRHARVEYARTRRLERTQERRDTRDTTETQIIETISELAYAGQGWHTTGDAMLAITAATQARERRRIGREEVEFARALSE